MISNYSNFWTLILYPNTWLNPWESSQCWWKGVLCSCWVGEMFCKCLLGAVWSIMQFKSNVSLLVFCLGDLSNAESRVLKSTTITVLESISTFRFNNICFIYLSVLTSSMYIFKLLCSLAELILLLLYDVLLCLFVRLLTWSLFCLIYV